MKLYLKSVVEMQKVMKAIQQLSFDYKMNDYKIIVVKYKDNLIFDFKW